MSGMTDMEAARVLEYIRGATDDTQAALDQADSATMDLYFRLELSV